MLNTEVKEQMSSGIGYTGRLTCSIGVKDHKKAAAWYTEVLGCTLLFENEEYGMSYLSTPLSNVEFDLYQMEEVKPSTNSALVFGVSDIHAARKTLEEKGVRFDGETRQLGSMVLLATFFDPDGNTFMFFQSLGGNS